MMTTMKNAEEVLEFLISTISLSTYDRRFLLNVHTTNILSQKPITSNQAKLFKQIVNNYHRQIHKQEQDASVLASLPWSLKIVQSTDEFTKAHIKIEDGKIILRTPYKSSFITEFRNMNALKWDGSERLYSGTYGLYTLKIVITVLKKHFDDIVYSDEVAAILHEADQYNTCRYWAPTLVKKNNRLYILASNEALDNALGDMQLNTTLPILAQLVAYGITIDHWLIQELTRETGKDTPAHTQLLFATSRQFNHEKSDLMGLKPLLESVDCDLVMLSKLFLSPANESLDELATYLGIPAKVSTSISTVHKVDKNYTMPIAIRSGKIGIYGAGNMFASKTIIIVDSSPVKLS